jgi:hypothetical protein
MSSVVDRRSLMWYYEKLRCRGISRVSVGLVWQVSNWKKSKFVVAMCKNQVCLALIIKTNRDRDEKKRRMFADISYSQISAVRSKKVNKQKRFVSLCRNACHQYCCVFCVKKAERGLGRWGNIMKDWEGLTINFIPEFIQWVSGI